MTIFMQTDGCSPPITAQRNKRHPSAAAPGREVFPGDRTRARHRNIRPTLVPAKQQPPARTEASKRVIRTPSDGHRSMRVPRPARQLPAAHLPRCAGHMASRPRRATALRAVERCWRNQTGLSPAGQQHRRLARARSQYPPCAGPATRRPVASSCACITQAQGIHPNRPTMLRSRSCRPERSNSSLWGTRRKRRGRGMGYNSTARRRRQRTEICLIHTCPGSGPSAPSAVLRLGLRRPEENDPSALQGQRRPSQRFKSGWAAEPCRRHRSRKGDSPDLGEN